jgi:hypothetical protein
MLPMTYFPLHSIIDGIRMRLSQSTIYNLQSHEIEYNAT